MSALLEQAKRQGPQGPQAPGEAGTDPASLRSNPPASVWAYLASATSKAAQKEYPNLLRNQVLAHFGGETALEHLCQDAQGNYTDLN